MAKEITPMMKQYFEIKEKCKDYILFYRLGDFYEMFFDDAEVSSKELDLVLTGRDWGQEERAPMCGVPHHSCEGYIARLVAKGYKIAICDQIEDAKAAKGIVKRDIVRMITPGTVTQSSMLDENKNNYICSVFSFENCSAICFADITTGEVYASIDTSKNQTEYIINEIGRFVPSEVILSNSTQNDVKLTEFLEKRIGCNVERLSYIGDDFEGVLACLCLQFNIADAKAYGLADSRTLVFCLDMLLGYLEKMQMCKLRNLNKLNVYTEGQFMTLDINSRRNLELCETMRSKEKKGTLLWVLDKTKTAMGARLLRSFIEKPLLNPIYIQKRQNAIEEFIKNYIKTDDITEMLKNMNDIERITGKLVYNTANCRDLRALYATLSKVPSIKTIVSTFSSKLVTQLCDMLDDLPEICKMIDNAIVEEPPTSLRDGGMIKETYSEEIALLQNASKGGKDKIFEIEMRERERTGIKTLKIRFNKVFGYYIEVTKANSADVPADYIRKQTLVNCERYITEELKTYESTVLGAEEKLKNLEYAIVCEIREKIAEQVHLIQSTAQAIAQIDVLSALSVVAKKNRYVKPEVDFSTTIDIKDGRHPVVEQMLKDDLFVPNDVLLDNDENRFAIITGPNMAGKSTYMRQVALIAIMAQMGSFVPAKYAKVGICDSVFTRVGASDDLTSGQSTFMVEMSEMAYILKNATPKSLLIIDEIGRGTSTFDGMSIARAVVEFASAKKPIGARTLFATHYHELTELETLLDGVKNYNIAVKKRGDDITFLRKIVRGGADDSYGIEVAKLAGVPNKVINRAKEVLLELESHGLTLSKTENSAIEERREQVSMFDMSANEVADRIRKIDINTLTPIEAMNIIYELQKMV